MIRRFTISLSLGLVLCLPVHSQTPTATPDFCNFETLTDHCNLFSPNGNEKIDLPDGTLIPNFSAILKINRENRISEELSRQASGTPKNDADYIRAKRKLLSLLNEISERELSSTFKFYIAENFFDFLDFVSQSNGSLKEEMSLPWPPEKPAEPRLVRREEARLRFFSLFSRAQIDRMQIIEREMRMVVSRSQKHRGITAVDEEMAQITPERAAYVGKLIEFAKLRIIELIGHGKGEASWSEVERNLIKKVRTVKVTALDDPALISSPHCISFLPNAFYSKLDHSINVCPKIYRLPDTAVLSSVAHELAHAIDPCGSQFGTYQIRTDKMAALGKSLLGPLSNQITKDDDRLLLLVELVKLAEKSTTTAMPFPLMVSPEAIQYFQDKGVLVPLVPGVPFAQYLLKDVYDCLKSKHGFRGFDEVAIRKVASEVVGARKQYRSEEYDPKTDEREILKAFSTYPECVNPEKHGQMGETMADWVAARVLGEFVSGIHFESALEKLGPIAIFGNLVCMQRFQGARDKQKNVAAVLEGAMRDQQFLRDEHPGSKERIEKIILTEKNIRKALGCPVARQLACEHHAR